MGKVKIEFGREWPFPLTYEDAIKRDGIYDSDGREPDGCAKYIISQGRIVCCVDYSHITNESYLKPVPSETILKTVFAEGGLREMVGYTLTITVDNTDK